MADPLPSWVPLNWSIVGNPVNWAIIILMVVLGTIIVQMMAGAIGTANKGA